MQKFDGFSGGELVRLLLEQKAHLFSNCDTQHSVANLIYYMNGELRNTWKMHKIDHGDPGELPGATIAFAQVRGGHVHLCQAGDCFAIWKKRDGTIGITENQVRAHEVEMNATIEKLQREVALELFGIRLEDAIDVQRKEIRAEMWDRFCPILKLARTQDINNADSPRGYGLVNGVGNTLLFQEIFHQKEMAILLLVTDGMIPWEAMKSMTDQEIAEKVLADYQEGGLTGLLRIARGIEKRVANVNYIDSAEATGIALEF